MKRKIFSSIFITAVASLLFTVLMTVGIIYTDKNGEVTNEVKTQAAYLSAALSELDAGKQAEFLAGISDKSDNRLTLIASDGTVLYDNRANAADMENHLDRPEVASALADGSGEATRDSDTIGKQTYYYALKLSDGSVIRIANTTKNTLGLLGKTAWSLGYTVFFVAAAALCVSIVLSQTLVRPINSLKLDKPLENDVYSELSPLLENMEAQNRRIDGQLRQLRSQREEFEYITANMTEGMVLLSSEGNVLVANAAAKRMLSDKTDGSYLRMCRDPEFIKAAQSALDGLSASAKTEKGGFVYSIYASGVKLPESDYAAVLLITDVTDRENAEKLRREFTANVSHELKTPLTSICGYAEIINNGLAKTQDVPAFAGKIQSEGQRLLSLIDDIIRLSQLDDGQLKDRFAPVALDEVCAQAAEHLKSAAEKAGITLKTDISEVGINGFEPALYEIVYNLLDNAIKYGKRGGNAGLKLYSDGDFAYINVTDDGAGIPKEAQRRVFERFYRVEKSRSKQTGGTGLGLSIVRHAVMLHGGQIDLQSEEGEGTAITVKLPLV